MIIANNITAQIRLTVWQMKVALGGLQTSTDGLIYQPTKVRNIKKGRYIPSINGLSSGVHRTH